MKIIFLIFFLFCSPLVYADDPFVAHVKRIRSIEDKIMQLEEEVGLKEETKKNQGNMGRVEQAMERILSIHSELIGLRRDMEIELSHVRGDHPEQGKIANLIVSVKTRLNKSKVRREVDPVSIKMNDLFKKVQRKYATYLEYKQAQESEEILRVNKLVKMQRGKRKDKEAKGYIKNKGRVQLSK